eukprot:GHVQ01035205.1.p1 GENE.GHVQ01035205.1~~GHVQ01035205.1.p1  ORF type:complete len:3786 (-),score=345.68 GHVQ01035205.1:543-11774(-)
MSHVLVKHQKTCDTDKSDDDFVATFVKTAVIKRVEETSQHTRPGQTGQDEVVFVFLLDLKRAADGTIGSYNICPPFVVKPTERLATVTVTVSDPELTTCATAATECLFSVSPARTSLKEPLVKLNVKPDCSGHAIAETTLKGSLPPEYSNPNLPIQHVLAIPLNSLMALKQTTLTKCWCTAPVCRVDRVIPSGKVALVGPTSVTQLTCYVGMKCVIEGAGPATEAFKVISIPPQKGACVRASELPKASRTVGFMDKGIPKLRHENVVLDNDDTKNKRVLCYQVLDRTVTRYQAIGAVTLLGPLPYSGTCSYRYPCVLSNLRAHDLPATSIFSVRQSCNKPTATLYEFNSITPNRATGHLNAWDLHGDGLMMVEPDKNMNLLLCWKMGEGEASDVGGYRVGTITVQGPTANQFAACESGNSCVMKLSGNIQAGAKFTAFVSSNAECGQPCQDIRRQDQQGLHRGNNGEIFGKPDESREGVTYRRNIAFDTWPLAAGRTAMCYCTDAPKSEAVEYGMVLTLGPIGNQMFVFDQDDQEPAILSDERDSAYKGTYADYIGGIQTHSSLGLINGICGHGQLVSKSRPPKQMSETPYLIEGLPSEASELGNLFVRHFHVSFHTLSDNGAAGKYSICYCVLKGIDNCTSSTEFVVEAGSVVLAGVRASSFSTVVMSGVPFSISVYNPRHAPHSRIAIFPEGMSCGDRTVTKVVDAFGPPQEGFALTEAPTVHRYLVESFLRVMRWDGLIVTVGEDTGVSCGARLEVCLCESKTLQHSVICSNPTIIGAAYNKLVGYVEMQGPGFVSYLDALNLRPVEEEQKRVTTLSLAGGMKLAIAGTGLTNHDMLAVVPQWHHGNNQNESHSACGVPDPPFFGSLMRVEVIESHRLEIFEELHAGIAMHGATVSLCWCSGITDCSDSLMFQTTVGTLQLTGGHIFDEVSVLPVSDIAISFSGILPTTPSRIHLVADTEYCNEAATISNPDMHRIVDWHPSSDIDMSAAEPSRSVDRWEIRGSVPALPTGSKRTNICLCVQRTEKPELTTQGNCKHSIWMGRMAVIGPTYRQKLEPIKTNEDRHVLILTGEDLSTTDSILIVRSSPQEKQRQSACDGEALTVETQEDEELYVEVTTPLRVSKDDRVEEFIVDARMGTGMYSVCWKQGPSGKYMYVTELSIIGIEPWQLFHKPEGDSSGNLVLRGWGLNEAAVCLKTINAMCESEHSACFSEATAENATDGTFIRAKLRTPGDIPETESLLQEATTDYRLCASIPGSLQSPVATAEERSYPITAGLLVNMNTYIQNLESLIKDSCDVHSKKYPQTNDFAKVGFERFMSGCTRIRQDGSGLLLVPHSGRLYEFEVTSTPAIEVSPTERLFWLASDLEASSITACDIGDYRVGKLALLAGNNLVLWAWPPETHTSPLLKLPLMGSIPSSVSIGRTHPDVEQSEEAPVFITDVLSNRLLVVQTSTGTVDAFPKDGDSFFFFASGVVAIKRIEPNDKPKPWVWDVFVADTTAHRIVWLVCVFSSTKPGDNSCLPQTGPVAEKLRFPTERRLHYPFSLSVQFIQDNKQGIHLLVGELFSGRILMYFFNPNADQTIVLSHTTTISHADMLLYLSSMSLKPKTVPTDEYSDSIEYLVSVAATRQTGVLQEQLMITRFSEIISLTPFSYPDIEDVPLSWHLGHPIQPIRPFHPYKGEAQLDTRIRYSCNNLITGLQIDPLTGEISGTLDGPFSGHSMTIRAFSTGRRKDWTSPPLTLDCPPGHEYDTDTTSCVPCSAGTYRPGDSAKWTAACLTCTEHQTTVGPGSASVEDCVCAAGFQIEGAGCTPCPSGRYKDYAAATLCEDMCDEGFVNDVTSGAKSMDDLQCYCPAGHYEVTTDMESFCHRAPQGTYAPAPPPSAQGERRKPATCPDGSDLPCSCPKNQITWESGSQSQEDCQCIAGLYIDEGGDPDECIKADRRHYATRETGLMACPANTYTPQLGAATVHQCFMCDPGYFKSGSHSCWPCWEDMFCPGGIAQRMDCRDSKTKSGRSMTAMACMCTAGTGSYGRSNLLDYPQPHCQECPIGTFQPQALSDATCIRCPQFATTLRTRRTSIRECVPLPGYYSPDENRLTTTGQLEVEIISSEQVAASVGDVLCERGIVRTTSPRTQMSVVYRTTLSECVQSCKENEYCFGVTFRSMAETRNSVGSFIYELQDPLSEESVRKFVAFLPCELYFMGGWMEPPTGGGFKGDITCDVQRPQIYRAWEKLAYKECRIHHYCPGGHIAEAVRCPPFSSSLAPGAKSVSECFCLAGYSRMGRETECARCGPGTFNAVYTKSAACQPCPASGFTTLVDIEELGQTKAETTGAATYRDCGCLPGFYFVPSQTPRDDIEDSTKNPTESDILNYYGTCEVCPDNAFCPGSEKRLGVVNHTQPSTCPDNSTAHQDVSAGTTNSLCLCNSGYYGSVDDGKQMCLPCAPGTFKKHRTNGRCTGACPEHSTSLPASTSQLQCYCEPNYFLYRDRCRNCPKGMLCKGTLTAKAFERLEKSQMQWTDIKATDHTAPVAQKDFFSMNVDWLQVLMAQEDEDEREASPAPDKPVRPSKRKKKRREMSSLLEIPSEPMTESLDTLQTGRADEALREKADSYAPYALPCKDEETCLGGAGNPCSEGNEGFLCSECHVGYERKELISKRCQPCPTTGSWRLWRRVITGLLLAFVVLFVVWLNQQTLKNGSHLHIAMLKIWLAWAISMIVIAAIERRNTKTEPQGVVWLVFQSIFSFPLTSSTALTDCWISGMDLPFSTRWYLEKWIGVAQPIVFCIFLTLCAALFLFVYKFYNTRHIAKIRSMIQTLLALPENVSSEEIVRRKYTILKLQDLRLLGIWRYIPVDQGSDSNQLQSASETVIHRFLVDMIPVCIACVYIVYQRIFGELVSMLYCVKLQDKTVLADLVTETCSPTNAKFLFSAVIATIVLALWGVGIPLATAMWSSKAPPYSPLYRHISLLVSGYTQRRRYWEAIVFLRRGAYVATLALFPSKHEHVEFKSLLQNGMTIFIATIALGLHLALEPFDGRSYNVLTRLETLGLLVTLCSTIVVQTSLVINISFAIWIPLVLSAAYSIILLWCAVVECGRHSFLQSPKYPYKLPAPWAMLSSVAASVAYLHHRSGVTVTYSPVLSDIVLRPALHYRRHGTSQDFAYVDWMSKMSKRSIEKRRKQWKLTGSNRRYLVQAINISLQQLVNQHILSIPGDWIEFVVRYGYCYIWWLKAAHLSSTESILTSDEIADVLPFPSLFLDACPLSEVLTGTTPTELSSQTICTEETVVSKQVRLVVARMFESSTFEELITLGDLYIAVLSLSRLPLTTVQELMSEFREQKEMTNYPAVHLTATVNRELEAEIQQLNDELNMKRLAGDVKEDLGYDLLKYYEKHEELEYLRTREQELYEELDREKERIYEELRSRAIVMQIQEDVQASTAADSETEEGDEVSVLGSEDEEERQEQERQQEADDDLWLLADVVDDIKAREKQQRRRVEYMSLKTADKGFVLSQVSTRIPTRPTQRRQTLLAARVATVSRPSPRTTPPRQMIRPIETGQRRRTLRAPDITGTTGRGATSISKRTLQGPAWKKATKPARRTVRGPELIHEPPRGVRRTTTAVGQSSVDGVEMTEMQTVTQTPIRRIVLHPSSPATVRGLATPTLPSAPRSLARPTSSTTARLLARPTSPATSSPSTVGKPTSPSTPRSAKRSPDPSTEPPRTVKKPTSPATPRTVERPPGPSTGTPRTMKKPGQ